MKTILLFIGLMTAAYSYADGYYEYGLDNLPPAPEDDDGIIDLDDAKLVFADRDFLSVTQYFSIRSVHSDCQQHPVGLVSFDVVWLDDYGQEVDERFYFESRELPMQCFEWNVNRPSVITALRMPRDEYLVPDNMLPSELHFAIARVAERIVPME